jgi:hypothetical protein
MSLTYIFVGPYVECLSKQQLFQLEDGPDLGAALRLVDGRKPMDWTIIGGNARRVKVGRRTMWQFCGVPSTRRGNPPRWPMFFTAGEVLDGPRLDHGVSTDWPNIDQAAEIAWFERAFAEELELLNRVFVDPPPRVRWGLVWWPDV